MLIYGTESNNKKLLDTEGFDQADFITNFL